LNEAGIVDRAESPTVNPDIWLKRFMTVGAGLEGLAGLGFLAVPSALVAQLLGSPLEANGVVVARLAGGGLLALGIVCWSARNTPTTVAGLGAAWAFLLYNVGAFVVLAGTRPDLSGRGLLVAGAAAVHGILAAGLLMILATQRRYRPVP
jgi:hypothetical protein